MRFPCGGFAVHSGNGGAGRRCGDKYCVYCNNPLHYIDAKWHFPSITCPRCKMVSYNSNDIEHKFCGNCHEWHEYMNDKKPVNIEEVREAIDKILKDEKIYCPYPECLVKYFEHHHLDRYTLTFLSKESLEKLNNK